MANTERFDGGAGSGPDRRDPDRSANGIAWRVAIRWLQVIGISAAAVSAPITARYSVSSGMSDYEARIGVIESKQQEQDRRIGTLETTCATKEMVAEIKSDLDERLGRIEVNLAQIAEHQSGPQR